MISMTGVPRGNGFLALPAAVLAVLALASLAYGLAAWLAQPDQGAADEPLQPIFVFPDFAATDIVDDRKQQFLEFMNYYIATENRKLADSRAELLELRARLSAGDRLTAADQALLDRYGERFQLPDSLTEPQERLAELLLRVDQVPPSLALGQAAKESGWGTSRFAKQANNIFGQWCYRQGCGLVPQGRDSGARHEVRKFADVSQAVAAYLMNINTFASYSGLRADRAAMRSEGRPLDAQELAGNLLRYSQQGAVYVESLRGLISYNRLQCRFDDPVPASADCPGL